MIFTISLVLSLNCSNSANKMLEYIMEPLPEIFKGKVVCKCCKPIFSSPYDRNIRLIIRERAKQAEKTIKAEKKKLIINMN